MITQRTRKRLLLAADLLMVAAMVGAVAMALSAPETAGASGSRPSHLPAPGPAARPPGCPADYEVVCRANLRPPLFDPPIVVASQPVAPPARPIPVHLIGTAVERGFSYAMLRTDSGETKMLGAGEAVDGVEVVTIAEFSATVRFQGQLVTLSVEKEGPRK